MKRVVDRHLQAWRTDSGRKPLLIRGARQVGKTYTARALGDSFDELVEVNFERVPAVGRLFETDLDPRRIVRDLRLITRKRVEPQVPPSQGPSTWSSRVNRRFSTSYRNLVSTVWEGRYDR